MTDFGNGTILQMVTESYGIANSDIQHDYLHITLLSYTLHFHTSMGDKFSFAIESIILIVSLLVRST